MRLTARIPVTAGLLTLSLLSATGCKRLRANDQLNKGVADFKNARYESAENHFQQAVKINPDDPNALIFLCTTYSSQIVPNLDSPDNKKLVQTALTCFRSVLKMQPTNVIALKQIASIDRNAGNPEEAKADEKKVIELTPGDSEAYYTIGVIDWAQAFKNANDVLASEGLHDEINGNLKISKPGCAKLSAENTPLITEGMQYLQKAIDLKSSYEEAMTYMSLIARRKGDLECGNAEAVKADLALADVWAKKSMGARAENEKKKEEKLKGGVSMQ